MILKYKRLHESVRAPEYATPQSACFDLRVCLQHVDKISFFIGEQKHEEDVASDKIFLSPYRKYLIPTGLIFDIPVGYQLQVFIRSGTALKKLKLVNSVGIIDSDYTQELFLLCESHGVTIEHGERIAQAQLVPVIRSEFEETENIEETFRTGGMGSTGVR